MPTITALALDSLLEQGFRNPNPKKSNLPRPILYATPDVTPLPDPPSSFTPSPYIINHKRRGPRLSQSFSQEDVVVYDTEPSDIAHKSEDTSMASRDEGKSNGGKSEEVENGAIGAEEAGKSGALEAGRGDESDDFVDFQDSMSTVSNTELDERSWKASTPSADYYDAFEEISSDGTTRSSYHDIEEELRELRRNLLVEIEKRKQAEEALENLQSQWQSLCQQLSLVGLTLPTLPVFTNEIGEEPSVDPAEEFCQQVVIARAVASSFGRACARVEVEMAMEPQIESKNFEIARLTDRLQYYEAANREMSQRNQEAVEMARQNRNRRKRRQRWIWSSIGLAVTLGATAVAWSYVPASKPSTHDGDNESATSNGN